MTMTLIIRGGRTSQFLQVETPKLSAAVIPSVLTASTYRWLACDLGASTWEQLPVKGSLFASACGITQRLTPSGLDPQSTLFYESSCSSYFFIQLLNNKQKKVQAVC